MQTFLDFLLKVLGLFGFISPVNAFDYGEVNVSWLQNDQMIFVPIDKDVDVLSVWLSMTVVTNPYTDSFEPIVLTLDNYVSEAISVPGGFQFKVKLVPESTAAVGWFVLGKSQ